jgi:hypothetical protein
LPPYGGVACRIATTLDVCIEQVQLAFKRSAALFRRALQQIFETGAQPARRLNRPGGAIADLLE